mgnify:CR=1 FL=1
MEWNPAYLWLLLALALAVGELFGGGLVLLALALAAWLAVMGPRLHHAGFDCATLNASLDSLGLQLEHVGGHVGHGPLDGLLLPLPERAADRPAHHHRTMPRHPQFADGLGDGRW